MLVSLLLTRFFPNSITNLGCTKKLAAPWKPSPFCSRLYCCSTLKTPIQSVLTYCSLFFSKLSASVILRFSQRLPMFLSPSYQTQCSSRWWTSLTSCRQGKSWRNFSCKGSHPHCYGSLTLWGRKFHSWRRGRGDKTHTNASPYSQRTAQFQCTRRSLLTFISKEKL